MKSNEATGHTQTTEFPQSEPESAVSELEAFWKESDQRSEAFWNEAHAQVGQNIAKIFNDFFNTPIDSTTAAQQEKNTPPTDGSLLMIEDRPNDTMSPC